MDSPGGGPPGNGVGGIFPCWNAAAVGRKDKIKNTHTHKKKKDIFHKDYESCTDPNLTSVQCSTYGVQQMGSF